MLYADKNLKSLEQTVNIELVNVCNWLTANKLSLNVKKSNFVIFRTYQKKIDSQIHLRMSDYNTNSCISLEEKEYVKYLGVLIDSNLTWKYHIRHITFKISKSIGIIAGLRHFVPKSTLLHIYQSLVLPYLSYGIAVWGQAAKMHLEKILILQKRVLRLIYFTPYTAHAVPLFVQSNIIPVNMLYFKTVSSLMHDVSHNRIPPNISTLFTYSNTIHHYHTRFSSKNNFCIKRSRINQLKNSFSRIGVKTWNSVPPDIRILSKHNFKKKLHEALLKVLSFEETYVDVSTLISKIMKYS